MNLFFLNRIQRKIVLSFFLGTCIIFTLSCKVTERYSGHRYLQDDVGYYNWDNKFQDSEKAKYYVIVGSFPEIEEVLKFKNELELKNYPVVILPIENGRIRVSVGVYSFKSNAEKIKKDFKEKNPTIIPWILIR